MLIKKCIRTNFNFIQNNKLTVEAELEENGFQKKEIYFISFFKFDQKKINFKQFAILNAFLIKKDNSKISKKIK